MIENDKIAAHHLARTAFVYVRQSSLTQVRNHLESQRMQYDLAATARELGFDNVSVIDEDLGRSGSGSEQRPGFIKLLAAVCEGRAGIVIALEASRLARNNRDWYHLLHLCALTETLVADAGRIYEPKDPDDRLLLGLKGTMSEFELSLLRQRAEAARQQMIRRGEVLTAVPVGYVRTEDHRCEMIPDRQVQEALGGVFRKFGELGSARQVLCYYRQEQIPLPSIRPGTRGREIVWSLPTYSRIHGLLVNPVYAGAFAYGRSRTVSVVKDGECRKTTGHRQPRELWQVLIPEHHKGYISWEEFVRNQEALAANSCKMEVRMSGSGAARAGQALLSGVLRCRRCGQSLHVNYGGSHGDSVRYECNSAHNHRLAPKCISFAGRKVDQAVSRLVLQVIEPAGVEAALALQDKQLLQEDEKRSSVRLALEKARYEAERAKRQYDAVEPENRLVATELETRWNAALHEVSEIEGRLAELDATCKPLSSIQRQRLMELGSDLAQAWDHPAATPQLRKRIIRTVIEEIMVDVRDHPAEVDLVIRWAGGVHTQLSVAKNRCGSHCFRTDENIVDLVRKLAEVSPDREIARLLNRFGYQTGKGNSWNESRVKSLRHNNQIEVFDSQSPREWVNLEEASEALGVSETTVRRLIHSGVLPARQAVSGAPWVIRKADLETGGVKSAAEAVRQGRSAPPPAAGQGIIPFQSTT